MITASPVFLLVEFFRRKETGDALDCPETFRSAGILETALITQSDIVYHVVQALDDMVGIDDIRIRESLLCHVIPVPSVMSGAPESAVSFKFVDAERLREMARQSETDGFEDSLDGIGRNAVVVRDLCERDRLDKGQQDGVKESLRHMQGRVDPVRSLIERGVAVLPDSWMFS